MINLKFLKIATLGILVFIPAIWKVYDYYYRTIEIHVPILGYIDTGVTKNELRHFEIAAEEYQQKRRELYQQFQSNQISAREYEDRSMKITWEEQSDPRITAVTGGPAKQVLKFLLDKI